jgi:hypothetical protein
VSSLLNLILSTPVLADYTQFRSDVKFFRFYFCCAAMPYKFDRPLLPDELMLRNEGISGRLCCWWPY